MTAAANGRSTANMWQGLREGAYSWAKGVLSVTSPTPPTEAEIQAKGAEFIGHVTIQDMNRYTQLAGQYLRSKQVLESLGESGQITGDAIFSPPWSTTARNPAVPTRYRLRVQREIEVRGFTRITRTEWSAYEFSGPPTSISDLLNQANALFAQTDYNARASINQILDYSVETV